MVTQVNSSLPAAQQNYSPVMSLVVVLAFEALIYLLTQTTTSLMDRVQPLDNPGKLHQAGCADFQNEFYDEAINKFTLALECDPDQNLQATILADRADVYLACGEIDEAQADYDLALQCHPEDALLARIYLKRGAFHANEGNHKQAIEDYNCAYGVDADPQMGVSIRYQRGCSYAALACYEEAIADFNEAANACAFSDQNLRLQILESRATAQIKIGRSEDALNDYQLALACDLEEDQRLHFQMSLFLCQGAICIKNSEYEKAIMNYTKALECVLQDPGERAHILYQRSYAYGRLKKFELCERDISEAILCVSKEDGVQLFGARAVARVALKRYAEAIEDFTTAMGINPADEEWKAELLYGRGVAHRESKKPDLARLDWEKALKCTFKKKGLRESIEGELNPKTTQSLGSISDVWGSVASNLPSRSQK
jgi:tetratricopeptide (TPR) repeat protein